MGIREECVRERGEMGVRAPPIILNIDFYSFKAAIAFEI
jgi:hypothetical protein